MILMLCTLFEDVKTNLSKFHE